MQIIELLNFCLSSDLKPVMHFFNQNIVSNSNMENLPINEVLFQQDFVEQKQAALEILVRVIRLHAEENYAILSSKQPLFSVMQDYM